MVKELKMFQGDNYMPVNNSGVIHMRWDWTSFVGSKPLPMYSERQNQKQNQPEMYQINLKDASTFIHNKNKDKQ